MDSKEKPDLRTLGGSVGDRSGRVSMDCGWPYQPKVEQEDGENYTFENKQEGHEN